MDRRDGKLYNKEHLLSLDADERKHFKEVSDEYLKQHPQVVKRNKVGRNDLCPCGSGKKFKHCCYMKV